MAARRISGNLALNAVRAAAHGGPRHTQQFPHIILFAPTNQFPYGPDASSRNRLHLASPQGGNAQAHGSLLLSPSGNGPMGPPMRPAYRITHRSQKGCGSAAYKNVGPPGRAAPATVHQSQTYFRSPFSSNVLLSAASVRRIGTSIGTS